MTPPKIISTPTVTPNLVCEEPKETTAPKTLSTEEPPSVNLTFPTRVPFPKEEPLIRQRPLFSPFDPTRYGLPANWQPKEVVIGQGKFPEVSNKEAAAELLLNDLPKLQTTEPDWLNAIINVLNQVRTADLDMANVAVNQGTNLRRFSEYAPKDKPLRPPNLDVQQNTLVNVHGEIRKVEGQKDSLITRWVIQYDKPLLHESGLHILGFSAADAPDIEYDKSFKDWQAVKNISGGDLDYENPIETGAPLRTDLNYVAPPLPEGHRDWIIAFNPVQDSILASVKAAGGFGKLDLLDFWPFQGPIEAGRGKLYLWAFNPTFGINISPFCEEKRQSGVPEAQLPDRCKIRPNTMPRKPGELVEFFSPLMDSFRNGLLKHAGPYYNPNSEYIAPFIERGETLLAWAKQKLGRSYSQPEQACKDLQGQWKEEHCLLPLPKSYSDITMVNGGQEDQCRKSCEELEVQWKDDTCEVDGKPVQADICLKENPKKQWKDGECRVEGEKIDLNLEQCSVGREPQCNASCEAIEGRWKDGECKVHGQVVTLSEEQCQTPIGRQPIPRRREQVERINRELARFGLPAQHRRRGSIIDWINTDLLHDPERLRDMKDKPKTVAHFRFNPGLISTPYGKVEVDGDTDLKVEYFAKPVEVADVENPGKTKWEAQVGLHVTLAPLKLGKTDIKVKGYHIAADALEAQKLEVVIPNLLGMSETQPATREPITATISGASTKGLLITSEQGHATLEMKQGTLQELNFTLNRPSLLFGTESDKKQDRLARLCKAQDLTCSAEGNPAEPALHVSIKGLSGTGITAGIPQFQVRGSAKFDIPSIELTQKFRSNEKETVSDLFTLEVPSLISEGSLDLLKSAESKCNFIHLEGRSELKNLLLKSQFKEDHYAIHGEVDLSGTIDRATFAKEGLGEVSFTTKTNGHKVNPLSGRIVVDAENPVQVAYQEAAEKKSPKLDFNLELPYGGVESKGALTIAPGAATIRNGSVHFKVEDKLQGTIEGQLDLQDASYRHIKEEPFKMGGMDMIPALSGAHAKGNFKLEIFEDGFRLSNPHYDAKSPNHERLSLGFSLGGTKLHHRPNFPDGPYKNLTETEGEAFATQFEVQRGQLEVKDFSNFEMRKLLVDEESKPTMMSLESGPIYLKQIEAGGKVWFNSQLFQMVQLSFPQIGGELSENNSHLPDVRALTSQLPEELKKELREELAGGDFIYAAGLRFERKPGGWMTQARDVLLSLHERGGLEQYVMMGIPQISFGMLGEKLFLPPLHNHLANIYINVPGRGGLTQLNTPENWRKALKREKP